MASSQIQWIIRTFFSLGYNMEIALFALEVDLGRAQDLGGMTNLAFLDLTEVFNTIHMESFWTSFKDR